MRRATLITELLSVSEANSPSMRPRAVRSRWALVLGALMLASGCQSSNSLTQLWNKPKGDKDKSLLSMLGQEPDKAGLPHPTSSKSKSSASLNALLDRGEEALSKYYQDHSPAHLTEAHRCYEQALKQEANNPESHHGLAIVCDLQQDYDSANIHYRAALERNPDNGKILSDLGWSLALQNRLSEAESLLLQATKLDPGNAQAIQNLAYVYAKQGDYNLAESTYRQVLNDLEVRQEMARLFPQGRPDMARAGERSKLPWQKKEGLTTEEISQRLASARDDSAADWQQKRTALEAVAPPTRTMEQQQAMIAQLEWERDEALRLVEARSRQSSNTPLVLDTPTDHRGDMQIQPQFQSRPTNTWEGQSVGTTFPGNRPSSSGRRVQNGFYPSDTSPQFPQQTNNIEQTGSRNPAVGPNGQPIKQALHQTSRQIDPRTGRPANSQVQQMEGQQSSLVPGGLSTPQPETHNPEAAPSGRVATFEEAKRRAALAGLGGPDSMFPVTTPEGGNRMAPGSGSTFGGSGFQQPPRMLPMDAAPHDLRQLLEAPSGQYTVPPNHSGMLNSPSGPSFSNPNFQQPLSPQIPLDNPMGNAGTNYSDQVYSAQQPYQQQPQQFSPAQQQYDQYPSQPQEGMAITPRAPGSHDRGDDARNRVNAELNQYGQSLQYNPAQYNSNSWNNTPTPSNGLPNQPRAENPNQLMTPGWNHQQYAPRMTPPPYPGRPTPSGSEDQYSTPRGYGAQSEYAPTPGNGYESSSGMTGDARDSEPAPIYSPGIQAPAPYNGGNRSTYSGGQGYGGPRIIPAPR